MEKKTVDITDEQNTWIDENAINFSKWVRQKLDQEIQENQD